MTVHTVHLLKRQGALGLYPKALERNCRIGYVYGVRRGLVRRQHALVRRAGVDINDLAVSVIKGDFQHNIFDGADAIIVDFSHNFERFGFFVFGGFLAEHAKRIVCDNAEIIPSQVQFIAAKGGSIGQLQLKWIGQLNFRHGQNGGAFGGRDYIIGVVVKCTDDAHVVYRGRCAIDYLTHYIGVAAFGKAVMAA